MGQHAERVAETMRAFNKIHDTEELRVIREAADRLLTARNDPRIGWVVISESDALGAWPVGIEATADEAIAIAATEAQATWGADRATSIAKLQADKAASEDGTDIGQPWELLDIESGVTITIHAVNLP